MDSNQNHQPAQQQQPAGVNITAATFASKFKSKREIWNFLSVDVGAYLPTYEHVTIYFLKELISGVKKVRWGLFI